MLFCMGSVECYFVWDLCYVERPSGRYEARPQKDISFRPLMEDKVKEVEEVDKPRQGQAQILGLLRPLLAATRTRRHLPRWLAPIRD